MHKIDGKPETWIETRISLRSSFPKMRTRNSSTLVLALQKRITNQGVTRPQGVTEIISKAPQHSTDESR